MDFSTFTKRIRASLRAIGISWRADPPEGYQSEIPASLIYGPQEISHLNLRNLSPLQLHIIEQLALGKSHSEIRTTIFTDWDGKEDRVRGGTDKIRDELEMILEAGKLGIDSDPTKLPPHQRDKLLVARAIWLAQRYTNKPPPIK